MLSKEIQIYLDAFRRLMRRGGVSNIKKMLDKNIVAGLPLEKDYPELIDHYLMCVTETMDKPDMDLLVEEVAS